jgi:hypothetical protein
MLKFIDQNIVVCPDMNISQDIEGNQFPVLCMILFKCMKILQDMESNQFHGFTFITGCGNTGVLCVERDHKSKSR